MPVDSKLQAIDAEASVLMKRGLALLTEPGADSVTAALACFDSALDLRRRLPIGTVPTFSYGLAACWLNRAEALMRLGQLQPAVDAFDEAIALMRALPLHDDPRFARRSIIAHQNRGRALHSQERVADAVDAFHEAKSILEQGHDIADRDYLLAAIWVNLANAHAAQATADDDSRARDAALRAVALVSRLEEADADAAEAGLMARHVLCHTVARTLSDRRLEAPSPSDDVHEATDLADEGLHLIRRWEQKGVTRFRALAVDLFRFGARVYARYQPQFLPEFLLENLDPAHSSPEYVGDAEMQSIAAQYRVI